MLNRNLKAFLPVFFLSSLLLAPKGFTRIQGKVTDPAGAPIPGAVVTLTGSTVSPMTTETSEDGSFRFLSLPPGKYSIRVILPGFSVKEVRNVIAAVDQAVELNISMGELPWPEPASKHPPQANKGATESPSPQGQNLSKEIDAQVKQLSLGQVMYNPPSEMTEQVKERVEVKISQSLNEDLTEGLRGRGIPDVEKLLVGSSMKVILLGKDFEILPLSEAVQRVFSSGSTLWEWDVIPLKPGTRQLYLAIAAIFDTQFGEKAKSYPVMDKTITVKINPSLPRTDWDKILKYTGAIVGITGGLLGILNILGILKGLKIIKKKKRPTVT